VASADTSLTIPDFRASERTFQLIVQVAGRAGRAELPGAVIVQTLHEEEPAIMYAATHDYDGFAQWELPLRKEAGFPPYARMVRFVVRDAKMSRAEQGAGELVRQLREALPADQVQIIGPQPAGVRKIRDQFRWQVLLLCARAGRIQQWIAPRMETITREIQADVVADVDPMALM
jgi:primosomal protein N' (replication factor Y)